MWSKIRSTSGPVLLMVVLLFMGVAYSVYRAATAFSVEVDSPGYELTPSNLIVSPELETVIPENDPVAIRVDQQGFRLSDQALFAISEGTVAMADALESNQMLADVLEELGYPSPNAQEQARSLQNIYKESSQESEFSVEREIGIQSEVSSVDYAQSTVDFQFIPDDGGEILSLTLYIGWEPIGGRWVPVAFSDNAL